MSSGWIELYPSSWLYNAGVVGFLKCLDEVDNLKGYLNNSIPDKYKFKNGGVEINPQVFNHISHDYYLNRDKVVNLKGKNPYYQNFIDTHGSQVNVFKDFIKSFYNNKSHGGECEICNNPTYVNLNRLDDTTNKFLEKIERFGLHHNVLLGPSENKFPNSSWCLSHSLKICHLCTFLIIHHHLAFTELADGTEIFINAPSFEIMYLLNRLVREIVISDRFTNKQVLDILGISLIELATKIHVTMGRWTQMNIEIVAKRNKTIDFYSLPQHTVKILTDRNIASTIARIGEFSVLECILEGKYNELLSMAHYSLSAHLEKQEGNTKREHILEMLNKYFKRERNRANLLEVSKMILSLYTKIIDRRAKYGG